MPDDAVPEDAVPGDAGAGGAAPRTTAPAPPRTGAVGPALTQVGEALDRVLARPGRDAVDRRAEWTALLASPLPVAGIGADAVLAELVDVVAPNGTRLTDPGFWGWITVAPSTVPVAAAALASVVGGQRYTVTALNLLEEQSLDWLAELFGLPGGMKGVYSSGGSVANLVALGAARQWAYERHGVDAAAEGVTALRPAVYASAEVHHTVQRSCGVLGLGRGCVRLVPTDDRLRMRPDALSAAMDADIAGGLTPVAVVGTAGTTNTGAIDPLRAVGEIAHERGAWFHVDGAYGLPGILDDRVAAAYDGLEQADSVIVDPHKWLNAPTGIAATFVPDRGLLHRAFTQEPADYLEAIASGDVRDAVMSLEAMGIPYSEFGVELSSPARGVVVWSILRELGRDGIAARIRHDNDLASRLAALVRAHPRLELLVDPQLSICCFRYLPATPAPEAEVDAINEAVLRRLWRETPHLPSSTRVHGRFALRPCFINPRTPAGMIDDLAADVVRLGDEIAATG